MKIRYAHTNIVAKDWQCLANFYIEVFGCVPKPPKRDQSGEWLDKGLGISNARLQGMHLTLPGFGKNGPTLEIYQYSEIAPKEKGLPNTRGLGHLAFEVDDVEAVLRIALQNGAIKLGEISGREVPGVGYITFLYIYDPEGNIIELQNWSKTF